MSEIGVVDTVTVDEDRKRVLVTVFLGPGRTEDEIPFRATSKGMWVVPEIDDLVEVYETAKGRVAARTPHSVPDYDMPSGLQAGDVALTVNDGTSIVLSKNSDGTYNIEMSADGNILIDGIDFDAHTHDFEDSTINDTGDGSGTESTETKTTDPPQ